MVDVEPPFVSNGQAAEAVQPGKCPLDHPPMPPKLLAGLDAAPRDACLDAAAVTSLTTSPEVIGLVSVKLGRPTTWSAALAADRRDGIQQIVEWFAVVDVGPGQKEDERDALPIGEKVSFCAWPAAVGRVRPGRLAPLLAAMDELSIQARLQSMRSARCSRCSSSRCRASQTPAACQSRSRRQHVTPEPHPISCGSISQGMPVRSTNRMPVRAARLPVRGRPPLGFADSTGSKGSISDQRVSETRGATMQPHAAFHTKVQGF